MTRAWSIAALGVASALALLAPPAVQARDKLPWADANPLESSGKPRHAKPRRAAQAPAANAPSKAVDDAPKPVAAPEVPVPEVRPAAPEGTSVPAPGDTATPPLPEDAATPDARPAEAAGTPDAAATDPKATAERPVTEIPVPDTRPKPAGEAASERAPDAPPPVVSPAPAPEVDEAPNAPDKLRARIPDVTPEASVKAAAAVEDAMACEVELKKRGVAFTVGETISEGECGVLRPVKLTRLSSGIAVSPDTQFLCRAALALDDWMTSSVVPAAKADFPGDALAEFRHASTYVCRPRASENGISEHARGSAIDIGAFVFESGREIGIAAQEAGTPEERFLKAVRSSACGPFSTVLGPGTDADHATHFHLDIAARKNKATYCR